MNLKRSYRYRLETAKKAVLIYYFIVVTLCLISLLLTRFVPEEDGIFNGLEMTSIIFLFVVGLNTFKEDFNMLLQNGITRKSVFNSAVLFLATISGVMAAIDMILSVLFASTGSYNMLFTGIYYGFVNNSSALPGGFLKTLCCFVWLAAFYFFASSLGLLITLFYYKMNNLVRIAVSISVPAVFLIILPSIDLILAPAGQESYGIFLAIGRFFMRIMGIFSDRVMPWIGVLTFLGISFVLHLINWSMVRRSVIK